MSDHEFEIQGEIEIEVQDFGGGGGGIPEAPEDGTLYGRKDGGWHHPDWVDIENRPEMDEYRTAEDQDAIDTALREDIDKNAGEIEILGEGVADALTRISQEESRAMGAEELLGESITALAEGESGLSERLDEEIDRAEGVEQALTGRVSAVETGLDGKVPVTRKINGKSLIDDVTITASDIDLSAYRTSAHQDAIDENKASNAAMTAEILRATGAEATLSAGLTAEATTRGNAVTELQTEIEAAEANIVNEKNLRVAADGVLDDKIAGLVLALTTKEDKSNKVPLSLTATSEQYADAASTVAFIQDLISTISTGLGIPISIAKESDIPSTGTDGTMYYVQDMDIHGEGHTGKVWWNANVSTTEWQYAVDQYGNLDGISIIETGGGAWQVSTEWLNGIISTAISAHNLDEDSHPDKAKILEAQPDIDWIDVCTSTTIQNVPKGRILLFDEDNIPVPDFSGTDGPVMYYGWQQSSDPWDLFGVYTTDKYDTTNWHIARFTVLRNGEGLEVGIIPTIPVYDNVDGTLIEDQYLVRYDMDKAPMRGGADGIDWNGFVEVKPRPAITDLGQLRDETLTYIAGLDETKAAREVVSMQRYQTVTVNGTDMKDGDEIYIRFSDNPAEGHSAWNFDGSQFSYEQAIARNLGELTLVNNDNKIIGLANVVSINPNASDIDHSTATAVVNLFGEGGGAGVPTLFESADELPDVNTLKVGDSFRVYNLRRGDEDITYPGYAGWVYVKESLEDYYTNEVQLNNRGSGYEGYYGSWSCGELRGYASIYYWEGTVGYLNFGDSPAGPGNNISTTDMTGEDVPIVVSGGGTGATIDIESTLHEAGKYYEIIPDPEPTFIWYRGNVDDHLDKYGEYCVILGGQFSFRFGEDDLTEDSFYRGQIIPVIYDEHVVGHLYVVDVEPQEDNPHNANCKVYCLFTINPYLPEKRGIYVWDNGDFHKDYSFTIEDIQNTFSHTYAPVAQLFTNTYSKLIPVFADEQSHLAGWLFREGSTPQYDEDTGKWSIDVMFLNAADYIEYDEIPDDGIMPAGILVYDHGRIAVANGQNRKRDSFDDDVESEQLIVLSGAIAEHYAESRYIVQGSIVSNDDKLYYAPNGFTSINIETDLADGNLIPVGSGGGIEYVPDDMYEYNVSTAEEWVAATTDMHNKYFAGTPIIRINQDLHWDDYPEYDYPPGTNIKCAGSYAPLQITTESGVTFNWGSLEFYCDAWYFAAGEIQNFGTQKGTVTISDAHALDIGSVVVAQGAETAVSIGGGGTDVTIRQLNVHGTFTIAEVGNGKLTLPQPEYWIINGQVIDNTPEHAYDTYERKDRIYDSLEDLTNDTTLPIGANAIVKNDVNPYKTLYVPSPDYANMETTNRITTSGGSWTSDRDGYIHYAAWGNGAAVKNVFINNEAIDYSNSDSGINGVLQITKGDVVTITNPDSSNLGVYFIPIKWTVSQNALAQVNKLTPMLATFDGGPDYAKIETVNRVTSVTGSGYAYRTNIWTVEKDGYAECRLVTTESAYGMEILVNNTWVFGNTTRNALSGDTTTYTVKISAGDKIQIGGNISSLSAYFMYFIPPREPQPIFVEGADIQSSIDIGKATIDAVDKTISIAGEYATYNNTVYSINRPDKWPVNQELDFGDGLYGQRITGTYSYTAGAAEGLVINKNVGMTKLIGYSGEINLNDTQAFPLNYFYGNSGTSPNHYYRCFRSGGNFTAYVYSLSNSITNKPYDIWITYTK
jgi:hypothetical protein